MRVRARGLAAKADCGCGMRAGLLIATHHRAGLALLPLLLSKLSGEQPGDFGDGMVQQALHCPLIKHYVLSPLG